MNNMFHGGNTMAKVTAATLASLKKENKKFGTITAYDAAFASLFDSCGVPALLIGDSLGMVIQGAPSTLSVTADEIAYHVRCVASRAVNSLIIADMPFMTYNTPEKACSTAAKLMSAGAAMVKLEGGAWLCDTIRQLVRNGAPVCGHLGLTPQSVNVFGGFKIQGRSDEDAERLVNDAIALEKASASAIVLECIPAALGKRITQSVGIPTIGIGAGPDTDGQILVMHDAFGITPGKTPKFAKNYLALTGNLEQAVKLYLKEVENGEFPSAEQSFS